MAQTTNYLGKLYIALSDWQNALDYGLRSEELIKNLGEEEYLVDVFLNLGSVYLGIHDLANGTRYVQQALDLIQRLSPGTQTEDKGRGLRILGDIALESGNQILAQELFNQAEMVFNEVANRLERGRLMVSSSRLAKAHTNQLLAKSCLMQAQKIFEELGARLDLVKLEELKKNLKNL